MKVVASCIFLRHWCNHQICTYLIYVSYMHLTYSTYILHYDYVFCIVRSAICGSHCKMQYVMLHIYNIRIEYCVHCAHYIDQINMMYEICNCRNVWVNGDCTAHKCVYNHTNVRRCVCMRECQECAHIIALSLSLACMPRL